MIIDPKTRLEIIYHNLLAQISGEEIVRSTVEFEENILLLPDDPIDLKRFSRIFVCGAGKASVSMATGLLEVLEDRCDGGLVITKKGDSQRLFGVKVLEAAHPVPDESSLEAGERMLEFATRTRSDDLVVFCLSGGASALMESLREGWNLEMLADMTQTLLRSGADISAINLARKGASRLKAGGLGKAFGDATVRVLVMSDVQGNPLDVIGSNPFGSLRHHILADNGTALRLLGGEPDFVTGEAQDVARHMVDAMTEPGLYIWGGEPTVVVRGRGVGGRCQEVALAAAIYLQGRENVAFLAGSTDGTDGPTDLAGAVVDGDTAREDAERHLAANDSGTYFDRYGGAIHTGPTGCNLNDIFLGWVGA
ncbi:DUF4147 domain-containing protein [bacterium]|nr:MAG: DUF4147 domain-containing protein [bacterium]